MRSKIINGGNGRTLAELPARQSGTMMTVKAALTQAQTLHPLDLVARLKYIEYKRDTCDPEDLAAWTDARDLTRDGIKN